MFFNYNFMRCILTCCVFLFIPASFLAPLNNAVSRQILNEDALTLPVLSGDATLT